MSRDAWTSNLKTSTNKYVCITAIYFIVYLYEIRKYDSIQYVSAIISFFILYSCIGLYIRYNHHRISPLIVAADLFLSGLCHVLAFGLRRMYAAYYFEKISRSTQEFFVVQTAMEAMISTFLSTIFYFGWVHAALLVATTYLTRHPQQR